VNKQLETFPFRARALIFVAALAVLGCAGGGRPRDAARDLGSGGSGGGADADTDSVTDALSEPGPPPEIDSITPAAGRAAPGGASVTIAGKGFMAGATVDIGGSALTDVTVSSDGTMITGTTTHHAPGVADVTVTNPDRGSNTLQGAYTYQAYKFVALLDDMEHATTTVPVTSDITAFRGISWQSITPSATSGQTTTLACAIKSDATDGAAGSSARGQYMNCAGYACNYGPDVQLMISGVVDDLSAYDAIQFWTRSYDMPGGTSTRSFQIFTSNYHDYNAPIATQTNDWVETTIYLSDLLGDQYSQPASTETLQSTLSGSNNGFQIQGGAAAAAATCVSPPGAANFSFDIDDVRFIQKSTIDDFQDNATVAAPYKLIFTPTAEGTGTWTSSSNAPLTVQSLAITASPSGTLFTRGTHNWAHLASTDAVAAGGTIDATVELRPRLTADGSSDGVLQPYDASAFVGLTYEARSNIGSVSVKLQDSTGHVSAPVVCTVPTAVTGDQPNGPCTVMFGTGVLAGFDPGDIAAITFEVTNATATATALDLDIDSVRFAWE
jgi:hypothetical protein